MAREKLRVIVTGASGMVGEGVLHECLQHPDVEAVLVLTRKHVDMHSPKLKEIIHQDFYDLSPIADKLKGYNACFFCLGVSSVGMKADDYYKVTYTLTMHVADILSRHNKDMVFCYVSGAGTDGSEKGRSRWARVKGKTENDLRKLPFKRAYGFRPGFIKPTPGLKQAHPFYKYIGWLFPIGRAFFPNGFCTLRELGLAMINIVYTDFPKDVVDGKDIIALANSK